MEPSEVWLQIFCAAVVAQREQPAEYADTQMKEYNKRFSFIEKAEAEEKTKGKK